MEIHPYDQGQLGPPIAAEPLLCVSNLRVHFGRLRAVAGISLSMGQGELLGLIGPNGSGKTTLLRAIAGLQPATAGEVRILGHHVEPGASDALRHIGFTPDTPALYAKLTVHKFLH